MPDFELSADERDELLELGWDAGVVEDLRNFLEYLDEIRRAEGPEAVAWALGQWAHALILSETTLDLVADVLFRRVQGCPEQRPQDLGMRGRLCVCVGFAGFQKLLGEFHTRLVQRLLQDAWMTARDIGDPPCLGRAGDVLEPRTNTAAVALETARERARAMVAQARAVRRARSGGDAGGGATSSARASTDPPPSQPVEVPDPEEADGDALDEDSDDVGMMQLTPGEEARLSQLGVNDEVRRRLRELLGGLARQDDWDVGPEYRWGVQQVVEAAVGAHATARCVVDVLAARVRPSEAMRSFPCQRIPPHGVLRSRIVAWLAEFRWVVVQAFDRELEEALLELTGCPPGEAHVLRPAGDPQLGWQRATRDVPRGSRSRSRSPRDGATVSPGGTAEAIHTGGRPPSVADAVASTSPVGVAGAAAAAPPTSPSSCALPCSPTTGVIGSLPEGVDTDEPQLVPGGTSALSPLCPSSSSATATSSGPALGVPSVLAAPPDSGGGEPRVQPGAGVLVDVVLNGDLGSSGSVAPRPLSFSPTTTRVAPELAPDEHSEGS